METSIVLEIVCDALTDSEPVDETLLERVMVLETEKDSDGVDVTETVSDMQ